MFYHLCFFLYTYEQLAVFGPDCGYLAAGLRPVCQAARSSGRSRRLQGLDRPTGTGDGMGDYQWEDLTQT
jgi:hypothetical protein